MKHKRKRIWIIYVVLAVLVITAFFRFWGVPYEAFPPSKEIKYGRVVCPEGFRCSATPILRCSDSVGEVSRVSLRCGFTNLDFLTNPKSVWFAKAKYPSSEYLTYYCFKNTQVGSSVPMPSMVGENDVVCNLAGNQVVFYSKDNNYGKYINSNNYYQFEECTIPNPAFVSRESQQITNTYEKFGSSVLYSCSESAFLNNQVVETLTWKSDIPTGSGGYKGKTYSLNAGDSFQFSEVEFVKYYIEPEPKSYCDSPAGKINVGQKVCSADSKKVYYCEPKSSGDPELKTETCLGINICNPSTKTCQEPYTFSIRINGEVPYDVKPIQVKRSSVLKVYVEVSSVLSEKFEVSASVGTSSDADFSDTPVRNLELTVPDAVGRYELNIYILHPQGTINKKYVVEAVEPVSVEMSSPSPIQSDELPVEVKACSYVGSQPTTFYDVEFSAEFRGENVVPSKVLRVSNCAIAKYDVKGFGKLIVRARVQQEKGSLWSDFSTSYTLQVESATISIKPSFVSKAGIGKYTNYFETISSAGNNVDTENEVTIYKTGVPTKVLVDREGIGKYSFTYDFREAGIYTVKIFSSRAGFVSGCLGDNCIGEPITILGGTAPSATPSPAGEIPPGSLPGRGVGSSVFVYVVVAAFVLVVGGMIYLIFRRKK